MYSPATPTPSARTAPERPATMGPLARLLGASLAVVIGLGFWLYWRSGPDIGPASASSTPAASAVIDTGSTAAEPGGRVGPSASVGRVEHQPATTDGERVAAPPAPFAQGLRGLVLNEADQPLRGIDVYLIESPSNDPLALPLLLQQRHAMGLLSATRTSEDGSFAISLQMVRDKIYEVHLVSADHATTRLGGLRLLTGQWHDLGVITLVSGSTLRGRVTVEGREDIPVPLATVTVEVGTAFEDAALRLLPGRERGLSTTVDANGYFELLHAPSRGVVRVWAVAPGFARVLRHNIELTTTRPIEINFGLPPGQSVGGRIVDGSDRPVQGARVEAWPQHGAAPALLAQSDSNGHFEVLGMLALPHRLRVFARGFQNHEVAGVQPGRHDLHIALQARGTARVRVLLPDGTVQRSYQLSLRRYFADRGSQDLGSQDLGRQDSGRLDTGGQIGLVVDVPEQRVRLDRMTDFAELQGVPMGTFKCQVVADGYAKTLSEPIVFGQGEAPGRTLGDSASGGGEVQSIDIVLSTGATLRGRVFDEAGRPLPGATVATQADGATPDSPLSKMLAGALPDKITVGRATTAADGSFALEHLALADYQLEVTHPDACRTIIAGLRLDTASERTLPAIQLVAGALVTGRATVGGRTAGQIKVVLTTEPIADPQTGPAPAERSIDRGALRLETVTDAEGHFQLPRRVPPGTYVLRAAVVGTAEPEAQIFQQLLQMRRSSTTVSVVAGQPRVDCTIDLPSDR
ncbi:MAG: carboxypeptidase regulatory-like domain-containing protein [Planctomycetota bacterium]